MGYLWGLDVMNTITLGEIFEGLLDYHTGGNLDAN